MYMQLARCCAIAGLITCGTGILGCGGRETPAPVPSGPAPPIAPPTITFIEPAAPAKIGPDQEIVPFVIEVKTASPDHETKSVSFALLLGTARADSFSVKLTEGPDGKKRARWDVPSSMLKGSPAKKRANGSMRPARAPIGAIKAIVSVSDPKTGGRENFEKVLPIEVLP